jgi:hypothetical protein
MIYLQWVTTVSPKGDLLASPNVGIFDTTRLFIVPQLPNATTITIDSYVYSNNAVSTNLYFL